MEITAWYDTVKRTKALENINEVYYYMVHSTNVNERRKWAIEYTRMLGGDEAHS